MATVLYRVLDPPPPDLPTPMPQHPIRRALFVVVAMVHIGVEYAVDAVRKYSPW